MNPAARWVAKESIVRLATMQKNTPMGISGTVRCGIDAYRLFDAIEEHMQGRVEPLRTLLPKLRVGDWLSSESTVLVATKQASVGYADPFTAVCVAAHKQLNDAKYMLSCTGDPEILHKIARRHDAYRAAQAAGVVIEERI